MITRLRSWVPVLLAVAFLAGSRLGGVAHHIVEHGNGACPDAACAITVAPAPAGCCEHEAHTRSGADTHEHTPGRPQGDESSDPETPSEGDECPVCVMLASLASWTPDHGATLAPAPTPVGRLWIDCGRLGSPGKLDDPRGRGPPGTGAIPS